MLTGVGGNAEVDRGHAVYGCPKHVELFMIINKIVASSWYLSSFSYMMQGHTYIKFANLQILSRYFCCKLGAPAVSNFLCIAFSCADRSDGSDVACD